MNKCESPFSAPALHLRRAQPEDHAALTDLWRRSVEATHRFLSPLAVDELYTAVLRDYLPAVEEVWLAEYRLENETRARPAGFMGCNGPQVEMLFVEPAFFGRGVGKTLLQRAQQRATKEGFALTLDVNEQNPSALAFYRHMGFAVTGRSPLDSAGRPYPLLHMEWRAR
ncbi:MULTISPECIES: GNAT family N-acetyltransferase [Desulfovibrio]|uniref:Acetyltransferase n=3 Tax=Desulfovibrio TaxID=872 RepID=A0AA94HRU7_DESDE|nr:MULTISPECIES: GNAT family N-acetyltransferase [Desulfovibrio]ATD82040.1 GNAT family N-acetyltransferase [Desulfovibrio sp. G11]SFW35357.1 putative acetyltransferase [Desulfovibrio desulfuricans]SPD34787.1 Gcn5-related N-acetyltransferase (GNAT) [Desulfovibrio sp. G11]